MTLTQAERVARALLYEGYSLYPYRPSAAKNRFRWTFGTLYAPTFAAAAGERCGFHGECIVRGERAWVQARLAFLQPAIASGLSDDGWQEAIERETTLQERELRTLIETPLEYDYTLAAGELTGAERCLRHRALHAQVHIGAERISEHALRLAVTVSNRSIDGEVTTPAQRARAALCALASVHIVLETRGGEFISAVSPPNELLGAVHDCRNDGVWPVLLGRAAPCSTLLFSPICVEDFPAIAPESSGDFFDATEIDEMLALRLQTLTDTEKLELRSTDPRARALLERAETLGTSGMSQLHGAWRSARASDPGRWALGDRVRLRPHPGRDVLDLALRGEAATVVGFEADREGRLYYAVTVDRDPGRDLGAQSVIGHRFFFEPDELERVS